MKKILIIEDTEYHMSDARKVAEEFPEIEFTFISNADELPGGSGGAGNVNFLGLNGFDGVVSDLHFPHTEGGEENANGILLAVLARVFGIPFIIVTDRYHHDADQEWLNEFFKFIRPRRPEEEDVLFSGHSFFKGSDRNRSNSLLDRYDTLNNDGKKYWKEAIIKLISYWDSK